MPALEHSLVPKISIASEDERKQVLERYGITAEKLPLIKSNDPALPEEAEPGDVVVVHRVSPIAKKEEPYYRLVIE